MHFVGEESLDCFQLFSLVFHHFARVGFGLVADEFTVDCVDALIVQFPVHLNVDRNVVFAVFLQDLVVFHFE